MLRPWSVAGKPVWHQEARYIYHRMLSTLLSPLSLHEAPRLEALSSPPTAKTERRSGQEEDPESPDRAPTDPNTNSLHISQTWGTVEKSVQMLFQRVPHLSDFSLSPLLFIFCLLFFSVVSESGLWRSGGMQRKILYHWKHPFVSPLVLAQGEGET